MSKFIDPQTGGMTSFFTAMTSYYQMKGEPTWLIDDRMSRIKKEFELLMKKFIRDATMDEGERTKLEAETN